MSNSDQKLPTSIEEIPALLTLSEVAELFRVSRCTVQEWKKSGRLPCVQYGRTVRVRKDEILRSSGIRPPRRQGRGRSLLDMKVPDYIGELD